MHSTKTNDFLKIKKTVTKLNKSMFNTNSEFESFNIFEQSSKINKTFDQINILRKKKENSNSPILDIYKHQHKNSTGVKIFQLPKLPFGSHLTYNDDSEFVNNHFRFEETGGELKSNLEGFQKKFELYEKKVSGSRKKGKSSHLQKAGTGNEVYVFKTQTGYLFCPPAKNVIDVYNNDKKVHRNETDYGLDLNQEKEKQKKGMKKKQDQLSQRLCPSRATSESPRSQFYSTKYSILFSNPSNTMPYHSLNPT